MPLETTTQRDERLIQEYGLFTPENAEAELQRCGIPYLMESRNDLQYKYHFVNGHGWVCWSMGKGYVAGSKLGAMLALLEAIRH